MTFKSVIVLLIVFVALMLIMFSSQGSQALSVGQTAVINGQHNYQQYPSRQTVVSRGPSPLAIQQGLGALVTALKPAVVSIASHPRDPNHHWQPGMQLLDPFPGQRAMIGSGVIVDDLGHIITTRQVTRDAELVRVTLYRSGKNTFSAQRIATDHNSDLVLLRLPFAGRLPHAVLADSSRVRTGDLVVAMGSPFGLSKTVTHGIVSNPHRTISAPGQSLANVIQTDAAINQGNSGGPLVNINAEVIGINAAIYSTDSTFAGIGFSIPSNQVRAFLQKTIGFRN
jgi:S1-C subfamily serine protease